MVDNPLLPFYGPVYFATMLSTGFYGVMCMQTFFYYVRYQNDSLCLKSFVAVAWTLNTVHEALIIAGAYKLIMATLEAPISSSNGPPELVLFFTSLVAVATQGFFVYRIYALIWKNLSLLLIFVPPVVYQLVTTFLYASKALYIADGVVRVVGLATLKDRFFMTMATSALSVAAAVNVMIAVILTLLLLRKRNAVGYANTAHILQRLKVFAVNAGIWMATFALLAAILLHVDPSKPTYGVFAFPLCSVYCNTLLASLHARANTRSEGTTQNFGVDLFTSSTSRASESQRSRVVSFRTSANLSEGHGGATFLPGLSNRQKTSTSENACA